MAGAYAGNFTLSSLHRRAHCGAVYSCCKCQVPIGDTNDWSGNHLGDNVVLLKAVSQFVIRGKLATSSDRHDASSQYHPLSCSNCYNVLGRFYCSTPDHLNYKLNLYNIDNSVIKGYTFGENLQQIIPESEAPITVEICQYYEEELKKQKLLLDMLLKRVSKLEDEVLPPPEEDS